MFKKIYRNVFRRLCVTLLIIGLLASPYVVYAEENNQIHLVSNPSILPEIINGEVELTAEQSPYSISQNGLTVTSEGSLTISAGTTIYMGNQPIVAHGALSIKGNHEMPVRFISADNQIKQRGIFIEADSDIGEMNGVYVENSADGIVISNHHNKIIFNDLTIKDSYAGIVALASDIEINNASVVNAPLVEVTTQTHLKIFGVNILPGESDPSIYITNSNADIKNISVSGQGVGTTIKIKTSQVNVASSTFNNVNTAISSDRSQLHVSDSKFINNINGIRFVKSGGVIVSFLKLVLPAIPTVHAESQNISDIQTITISKSSFLSNSGFAVQNDATTTVDARNNEWGSTTGPNHISNPEGQGEKIKGNVLFDPWNGKTEQKICCSNVLFVPGIQASRLYMAGGLFGENQLWEPNRNADVEKIYLNNNGDPIHSGIYTRDVIDTTNIAGGAGFDVDIYKGFIDRMNSLVGDKTINKFESLPYDWRFDQDKIARGNISLASDEYNFVDKLKEFASSSKTGKVSVVAHSYGGLVLKSLLASVKNNTALTTLIDTVVLIASPQKGAPKSIASVLYGDDQQIGKGLILSKSTAQKLAENSPSVYSLLPQKNFDQIPLVFLDSNITDPNFPGKINGGNIKTRTMLNQFIKDMAPKADGLAGNINETMLASSTNMSIYGVADFPRNVATYQIAGTGLQTTYGLKYESRSACKPDERGVCQTIREIDHRSVNNSLGDGTVPLESALALPVQSYIVALNKLNQESGKNISHADIVSSADVSGLIASILKQATTTFASPYISYRANGSGQTSLTNNKNNIQISVHSPANIMITDTSNRKTGAYTIPNSDIKGVLEQIPNSKYEEIGEGKYVTLPQEKISKVEIIGTDYGSFTLKMIPLINSADGIVVESTTTAKEFAQVPINNQAVATIDWNQQVTASSTNQNGLPQTLKIDFNNDGVSDGVYNATPIYIVGSSTAASSTVQQSQRIKFFKLFIAFIKNILESIHFPFSNVVKHGVEIKLKNLEKKVDQGLLIPTEKMHNQITHLLDVISSFGKGNTKPNTLQLVGLGDKINRILGGI